jgi:hypothetical protein
MGFGDPSYPLSTTLEVPSVPSDSNLYEGMTDAQRFVLYALEDAETLRRLFERDHPDEVVLYDALAAVRRWIGGLDNREELERAASAVAINYLGPSVFAHQSVPAHRTAMYVHKIICATLEPQRAEYHIERALYNADLALAQIHED